MVDNAEGKNDINNHSSNLVSNEIQKFIEQEHDLLKFNITSKTNQILFKLIWQNKWHITIFVFTILGLFAIPIISLLENPQKPFYALLSLILFLEIVSLVYLLIQYFFQGKKAYKKIRNEAIRRAYKYDLSNYYNLIANLGNTFLSSDINREETRFKAIINQRKNQKSFSKTIGLFTAIFIVVLSIWILGVPNDSQTISIFYGAIVGVSGIVIVVKNSLDLYLELLYRDIGIYEQCVLILQEAQKIAAEREADEDTNDVYLYDKAIAENDEIIPFERANFEIENNF